MSVITYVSSLYDVFPEVPTVEQSLMNSVSPLSLSCLIASLSSLYDVFPEVPTVEQSLMDNVSSLSLSIKVSHYLRIVPV